MLPAPVRMRDRTDFRDAVRRGRRCGCSFVVLHLLVPDVEPTEPAESGTGGGRGAGGPKVGFVVSRQVGGSVVRHTVQRRLRHAARDVVPQLPPGTRLVVRALPRSASASFAALHEDLERGVARCLSTGRPKARSSAVAVRGRGEEGAR